MVVAVAAIAIGVVLLNGGSDERDSQGPIAALAISPEDARTGIAVGNKVPDFEIRLNNGNIVSASNQVEEGKPTFYFFFATW